MSSTATELEPRMNADYTDEFSKMTGECLIPLGLRTSYATNV